MSESSDGFAPSKLASWLLLNSKRSALAMLFGGIGGGFVAADAWGAPLFATFGGLLIALGVVGFGIVASELLNRAQDGFWAREGDDPAELFSASNNRRVLNLQTLIVVIGTIQSSFGAILFWSE